MVQGQRPEYEEMDHSLDVTALTLSAAWHNQQAIEKLKRANQIIEERATHARREARQTRGR